MATIGDQLLQPEAGWRRYDDSDSVFEYTGAWLLGTSNSHYKQRARVTSDTTSTVSFKFTGTRLRIIAFRNANQSPNIVITIDGENQSFSLTNTSDAFMSLVFEKLNLTAGVHTVTIKSNATGNFTFDAVDIDETGEILYFSPVITTGKLCNTLDEMDIGDYIVWKRDGAVHSFGGSIDSYIALPVTGIASSSLPTKHFHYAIKVDTGLLISDRVTEHTISWDTLNSQKRIQGLPVIISGVSGVIRSLTGGVAWADQNGNKSLNFLGDYDLFPNNNEWDKYIMNFPMNNIQQNKTLNDVWHGDRQVGQPYTICQDTPINGLRNREGSTTIGVNTNRVARAWSTTGGAFAYVMASPVTTLVNPVYGFRPVFEYKEV